MKSRRTYILTWTLSDMGVSHTPINVPVGSIRSPPVGSYQFCQLHFHYFVWQLSPLMYNMDVPTWKSWSRIFPPSHVFSPPTFVRRCCEVFTCFFLIAQSLINLWSLILRALHCLNNSTFDSPPIYFNPPQLKANIFNIHWLINLHGALSPISIRVWKPATLSRMNIFVYGISNKENSGCRDLI